MGVVLVGTKVLLGRGGGIPTRHSGQGLPNPLPNVSIASPAGVVEGTGNIAFTVTLSVIGTSDVTVDYATSNGTALAGTNYTAASGTLTIPAGQLTGTITVTVSNPSGYHGTKQFTLTLSNADHDGDALTITSATATGTILDNEANPDGGPHDYYEELIARGDLHAHASMRSQAVYGSSSTGSITYDPDNDTYPLAQDAAKITILGVGGLNTAAQSRHTINLQAGGRYLITWDFWGGEEFQTERGAINQLKTFQFSRPSETISLEVRLRLSYTSLPDGISGTDIRKYGTTLGPGVTDLDPLAPQLSAFTLAPNTWTRYWVLLDLQYDGAGAWSYVSMWMADETRDAVQIFDALPFASVFPGVAFDKFWWEFNSSQTRVDPQAMIGYGRNLVVLDDPADVSTLILTKPVGG